MKNNNQMAYAQDTVYRTVLGQILENTERLPSLPAITHKLRQAIHEQDCNWVELANLIREDPGLSALLLKYASSPLYRTQGGSPKTIKEIISRMGIKTLDNLIMAHSIKSVFVIKNLMLLKEYKLIWKRQILKAGLSSFLARQIKYHQPDEAVLASLLTEVGSLAILMAFDEQENVPDAATYILLCRLYSKKLAYLLLAKWKVDNSLVYIVKQNGVWNHSTDGPVNLLDLINLATYHAASWGNRKPKDLPLLSSLPSYQKFFPPLNELTDDGKLKLIQDNQEGINEIISSLEMH